MYLRICARDHRRWDRGRLFRHWRLWSSWHSLLSFFAFRKGKCVEIWPFAVDRLDIWEYEARRDETRLEEHVFVHRGLERELRATTWHSRLPESVGENIKSTEANHPISSAASPGKADDSFTSDVVSQTSQLLNRLTTAKLNIYSRFVLDTSIRQISPGN